MRRIHGLCLFGCDAEEWGVERLEVLLQEVCMSITVINQDCSEVKSGFELC
jgi:hypothetical protein